MSNAYLLTDVYSVLYSVLSGWLRRWFVCTRASATIDENGAPHEVVCVYLYIYIYTLERKEAEALLIVRMFDGKIKKSIRR